MASKTRHKVNLSIKTWCLLVALFFADNRLSFGQTLQSQQKLISSHLDSLRHFSSQGDNEKALLQALRCIELNIDSIGKPEQLMFFHKDLGNILKKFNAFSQSIVHLKKGLYLQEKLNLNKSSNYYYGIAGVGLAYLSLNEIDSAIVFFKKGLEVAKIPVMKKLLSNAQNNLGYCYFLQNNLSKAAQYLFAARVNNKLLMPEDSFLMAAIYDNLSLISFSKNNPDSALEYSIKCVNFIRTTSLKTTPLSLKYYISLAERYQNLEKHDKAISTLNLVLAKIEEFNFSNEIENKLTALNLMRISYRAVGHHDAANAVTTEQLALQQQIINGEIEKNEKHSKLISEFEIARIKSLQKINKLALDKNTLDYKLLKQATRTRTFIAITIISSFISLLIISVLVIRKRNKELRLEKRERILATELEAIEKEKLNLQIQNKNRNLTEFALDNTRKRDRINSVIKSLDEIVKEDVSKMKLGVNRLRLELIKQNQNDIKSKAFEHNIDSINTEFYDNLLLNHPDLSKSEAELCGFIMLGLSGKEISVIKNIEAKSVTRSKNRLRKKLGLEPHSDIKMYLNEVQTTINS
ncbi:MAG: hypothetical protein KDC92_03890 [Bacteroidetes bacterium]|nr:hypothetical protein [Bacteroidota bacterium]